MVQVEILLRQGEFVDFFHESHHGIAGTEEADHKIVEIVGRVQGCVTALAQNGVEPFRRDLLVGSELAAVSEEDQKTDQGSAVGIEDALNVIADCAFAGAVKDDPPPLVELWRTGR